MLTLILAIIITIGVSAFCSLIEAILLSSTPAEIEALKKKNEVLGKKMESFRRNIQETSSAILALNTIANTLGAVVIGGIAARVLGNHGILSFSIGLSLGILFFAEILPKNIGVLYRKTLLANSVNMIQCARFIMFPLSWVCNHLIRFLLPTQNKITISDQEIILLAEKSTQEGSMTPVKRDLIKNALLLDNTLVEDLMTPRTVVFTLEDHLTIDQVVTTHPALPFSRIPLYKEEFDDIVGVVRRQDILKAYMEKKGDLTLNHIMQKTLFLPETGSATSALNEFLESNQQLAVVVDEFGSFAGVVTLEDVIECLLGREIFEKDDMAVNMRDFARFKKKLENKANAQSSTPKKKPQ